MIHIEIPFTNDSFFLTLDFDPEFKAHIGFIKNQLVGRTFNGQYKRWEIPYLSQNIRICRAFASKFSNIEKLDDLEQYESAIYFKVHIFSSEEYACEFIYDDTIRHIIKSHMKYPKDKGFQESSKWWVITQDTWNQCKFEILDYLESIEENYEFPSGEDFEQIASMKPRNRNFNMSEEAFEELCTTVKLEYPFLREYQARDIAKYTTTTNLLNANQMGLGKTIESLGYIHLEKTQKVLIVVPNSLKIQWKNEIKKFFPDLSNRVVVINGNKKKREKLWKVLDKSKYIIITNYENLRTDDYINFSLNKEQFDMLILDEITRCKNHDTQTFKLVEKLISKKTVGLTGTPIENHLRDIFNIMKIIHPVFFGSWSEFANKYMYKGGYMGKEWIEKSNAPYQVAQDLKEFFGWIRWNRKSVLKELPELLINTYRVQLKGAERKHYELLKLKLLEIYDKKGYKVNTKHILSLILSMRRMCSDPEIYDFKYKNSAKKSEFVEVINQNIDGKKIVCFSQFKDCIYLYSKALNNKGIKTMILTGDTKIEDRDELIEEFEKSKEVKVLMCTDAFAYGKNLQMCSMLINIDQHFNPAVIKQRIGRIQRIGQKESTINVINFLVEDSIEEFVYDKIMRKNMLFDTVITSNESKFSFIKTVKEYLQPKEEEIKDGA